MSEGGSALTSLFIYTQYYYDNAVPKGCEGLYMIYLEIPGPLLLVKKKRVHCVSLQVRPALTRLLVLRPPVCVKLRLSSRCNLAI